METTIALRVCVEKNEDIDLLNKYLAMGYKVIHQSDVCQRFVAPNGKELDGTFYYATIVYILERKDEE